MAEAKPEHSEEAKPERSEEAKVPTVISVKIVKDQNSKGRGLIATKDFKAGDTVVLYSKKKEKIKDLTVEDHEYMYSMTVKGKELYFYGSGDRGVKPLVPEARKEELGGLVNDACPSEFISKLNGCKDIDDVEKWTQEYKVESLSRRNVIAEVVGESLYLVAFRDIKSGEDILSSYSPAFWVQRVTFDKKARVEARTSCLLWELFTFPSQLPTLPLIKGMWALYNPLNKTLIMHPRTQYTEEHPDSEIPGLVDKLLEELGWKNRGIEYWKEIMLSLGITVE